MWPQSVGPVNVYDVTYGFQQPATNFLRRLCAALFKPVDISFLIFFRILFGGIMLWEVCRYFMHDWITRYYVDPVVTFTYYGFSWVKPWPERDVLSFFRAWFGRRLCDGWFFHQHTRAL
jgi:uncharacterized protein YggT (Ycf19 family)